MRFGLETNPMHKPSTAEIQRIIALITDIDHVLRSQNTILQQRGMALPPQTMENLSAAQKDSETLATGLHNQQVELSRLHALADTSALVNSSLGLDEVLNQVMDTVIRLTGAERGYLVLRENHGKDMTFRVARNLDRETIQQGEFIVSRSVVKQVAETGQPIVTTNAQSDPRFADQESIVSYALRSILCVPLKLKDEVTGVVYADNRIRSGLFAESELNLLVSFANQAAVAIEHARLFEQVRAALDEITENKDLLENVFASIASGVITTATNGNIIICNETAARIFAIDADAALGRPIQEILPYLDSTFFDTMNRVHYEDAREAFELQLDLAERGQIILDVRLSPLKNHDQTTHGVTILIDDQTERRRREAIMTEVQRYLPPAMVENIYEIDTIELGGQEREISVVFADVRGFTSFSEQLPPEELMTIINQYLTVGSDCIHLYEGIIDKYMGDAVVGLYNTQLNPQEDNHALRAVRAAMSMMYDIEALHATLPDSHKLWYGIGIDTGAAVLGNVGSDERKEFTALGRPLTQAKKLQETAERGEIVISEATYQQVKDRVMADRVERPFRGEDKPSVMYKVLGFKQQ